MAKAKAQPKPATAGAARRAAEGFSTQYSIKRNDDEINDVMNWADEAENSGESKFPGMTFEQGVAQMFRWLTGDSEDRPDAD